MEEKEPMKVKLSTVLLISAVIVIIAIGVIIGIMYKRSITNNNNVTNTENGGPQRYSNNLNTESVVSENNRNNLNTEINFSKTEIEETFDEFLRLFGAMQGSPDFVLKEMKKITGKNVIDDVYPSSISYNGYPIIKSNIKYSEYKEFMLNYMTEELFNTHFTRTFVNKDGDLYFMAIKGVAVLYEVINVEKVNGSDFKYKAKVKKLYSENDKDEGEILFEIANNNGKCVISSITLSSEIQ